MITAAMGAGAVSCSIVSSLVMSSSVGRAASLDGPRGNSRAVRFFAAWRLWSKRSFTELGRASISRAHTIGAHAVGPGLEPIGRRRSSADKVQRDEAEDAEARMTTPDPDTSVAREFVQFAVDAGVLRFGEFKTKAGRLSPYFFNSGLFDDGAKLLRVGEFYARRLVASGIAFDMLFGPAYKG